MEYSSSNLNNNEQYFYVKRSKFKTYKNFKFYSSNLDEINLLSFNFIDSNLFSDVNINKYLKYTIIFKINDETLKLKYKSKKWELNYQNNKTIIKKCKKNIDGNKLFSYDMIIIKDKDNNKFKKMIENNHNTIINSFKSNNLFFFEGIIDSSINHFDSNKCIICYDELKQKKNIVSLCCKHRFHTQCLKQWMKQSKSCPICREKISINNILEKNKINILTCTSPTLRTNNIPTMSFSPIKNGLASTKNIKLEFNFDSVYKSIKLTDDIFGVGFNYPLTIYDALALTLVNLSNNRSI